MRHARIQWMLAGFAALGLASWAQGCLFAPSDCDDLLKCPDQSTGSSTSSSGPGGAGGEGASSSTSATASSSTGTVECTTAKDCPGTSSLCGEVTCVAGMCKLQQLQPDGPSFSQLYGDCHVTECAKGQLVDKVDNKEIYDDGNECTTSTCKDGVVSTTVNIGLKCGTSGICNAAGACVDCLANGDCSGSAPICSGSKCVPSTCVNGIQDLTESDLDCGGPSCALCQDGQVCDNAPGCLSNVCSIKSGESVKTCHHDCNDGMRNGTETGIDCGGSICATRCPAEDGCIGPADCESGVCKQGLCQAPTCTDGVKNDMETGVDCGASGCILKTCPGG